MHPTPPPFPGLSPPYSVSRGSWKLRQCHQKSKSASPPRPFSEPKNKSKRTNRLPRHSVGPIEEESSTLPQHQLMAYLRKCSTARHGIRARETIKAPGQSNQIVLSQPGCGVVRNFRNSKQFSVKTENLLWYCASTPSAYHALPCYHAQAYHAGLQDYDVSRPQKIVATSLAATGATICVHGCPAVVCCCNSTAVTFVSPAWHPPPGRVVVLHLQHHQPQCS